MDNLSRRKETAEEEFANLKDKEEFFCERFSHQTNRQMRKPTKWQAVRHKKNDKPVYCFAVCERPRPRLWSLKDALYLCSDEEAEKGKSNVIFKIFILVPEFCSLYHFANFIAPSDAIACVAAGSKVYLFGDGCGTRVWYMDLVRNRKQPGKEWKLAKECLNREKHHPLSFSLGNKIYALETLYLRTKKQNGDYDDYDDYCFEVLDTSTDGSCWRSLCKPPFPFGGCSVVNSWSSDGGDDQNDESRIFIEGCFSSAKYLFIYDVDTNTWDKFKQDCSLSLVDYPQIRIGHLPYYKWALHLVGKDFAPFPPHVPYSGVLRVLTGLNRSIPQLQQVASQCQDRFSLPFPVKAKTDRKKKLTVQCKNSSRCLTGWDLESLWTLHCLPVQKMRFWQAIHLGGSSFCTIAFYLHSNCCSPHKNLYARVANFDITDAAAGGASDGPVFSAKYGPNKIYLVSKTIDVSPLPCSKLQPV